MEMTLDAIVFAAISAAIFAVLWRLHRDVEALRRTMLGGARLPAPGCGGDQRPAGESEGMLMGAGLRVRLDA